MEKLKAMWDLLFAKSYLVVGRKQAFVSVPTINPENMNDVRLLLMQSVAIVTVQEMFSQGLADYQKRLDKELSKLEKLEKSKAKKGKGKR